MDSNIIKWFLIGLIFFFLVGTIIPMVFVKKKGLDPHGTRLNASILTRLSLVSILMWNMYLILYIFMENVIGNFLAFEFLNQDFLIIFGMILACISSIFEIFGMTTLGENFRIELPKEKTELVTNGIYRIMRNPIVFGVFLILIGSFFVIPTVPILCICVFNIITFNSKVKDEEKFLTKKFGEKYLKYKQEVGRYCPFSLKKKENNK
ncbi:MAG: isoprenylcysteine carboxylmethyltransferase family protein [Candidatus Lokiarchaeota archaeon]|nr:isoprenylcysteine carboxylmethyltransferase family protein [Candidatus Lokiarchaeota archaeon]